MVFQMVCFHWILPLLLLELVAFFQYSAQQQQPQEIRGSFGLQLAQNSGGGYGYPSPEQRAQLAQQLLQQYGSGNGQQQQQQYPYGSSSNANANNWQTSAANTYPSSSYQQQQSGQQQYGYSPQNSSPYYSQSTGSSAAGAFGQQQTSLHNNIPYAQQQQQQQQQQPYGQSTASASQQQFGNTAGQQNIYGQQQQHQTPNYWDGSGGLGSTSTNTQYMGQQSTGTVGGPLHPQFQSPSSRIVFPDDAKGRQQQQQQQHPLWYNSANSPTISSVSSRTALWAALLTAIIWPIMYQCV